MRYYLSPSLMCMDMMKLTEQLHFLNGKADRLHVDIMDGHYVKNLALSASFVAQIRPYTSLPIDVHLMVEEPASFIPSLIEAGADAISLHPETICREAFRLINMLRQAGKEVGVVLNPATPVESIQHYLHLLDKVTVMTVDPGYAGQPFIPEMLAKIAQLRQLKESGNLSFLLEVDGSCNRNTYRELLGAGAQILVMGSSGLFRPDMPLEQAWEKCPAICPPRCTPTSSYKGANDVRKSLCFWFIQFRHGCQGGALSGTGRVVSGLRKYDQRRGERGEPGHRRAKSGGECPLYRQDWQ